jgi:hypothetical protein
MPHIRSHLFIAASCAVSVGWLHAAPVNAAARHLHEAVADAVLLAADDGVAVHEAWARASPGASSTGAVYVTLMGGAQPDSLVSVSTPVAARAEVHETINESGIMKMRPTGPIAVPAGQMVTFAPGGSHIMLIDLKRKLVAGESFPLTLRFAHAAPITVEVKVRGLGREAPAGHDPMGHDPMHMQ